MIGRDCRSVVRRYATLSRSDKAGVTRKGVGPTYLNKMCHSLLFSRQKRGRSNLFTQKETLFTIIEGPLLPNESGIGGGSRRVVAGLRGIGPALARKLGGSWSFRAARESRGRSHLFTQKGTLFTILEGPFLPKSWGVSEGSRRVAVGLRGTDPATALES